MPKLKCHLSIGYPTAIHEDVIKIDDEEYAKCKTDDERDELCYEYWKEWAGNYIDGYHEIVG